MSASRLIGGVALRMFALQRASCNAATSACPGVSHPPPKLRQGPHPAGQGPRSFQYLHRRAHGTAAQPLPTPGGGPSGPHSGREGGLGAQPSKRGGSRSRLSRHCDVVVVGLGAYGSSVLYHLAKAGLKVIGVERYRPVGHSLGSSHGASRIIRMAYFEGLQYGPLLKRSLRLFLELQEELAAVQGPLREPLFLRTGMLDVGSVFPAALRSAQAHHLPHEVLTGEQLNRRFPAYQVPEHWRALYQPDGGVLAPERIVQAHVLLAERLGAEVLAGHRVVSWGTEGSAPDSAVIFEVAPSEGEAEAEEVAGGPAAGEVTSITAAAAVLTPGPWIGQLVPELRELCVPERQVVGWFEVEPAARRDFAPDRFPVFVIEEAPGGAAYYGFPEHGDMAGFKIGLYRHLREQLRNPMALESVRRTADAADEAALRAGVSSYFPAASRGRLLAASTCFFTNTPDGHFLVDRHPRHPQVVLCSACSGHGFKMSSGIGQLIARMVAAGPLGAASSSSAAAAASASSSVRPYAEVSGAAQPRRSAGGWEELLPFRFDPGRRPGHLQALSRF